MSVLLHVSQQKNTVIVYSNDKKRFFCGLNKGDEGRDTSELSVPKIFLLLVHFLMW